MLLGTGVTEWKNEWNRGNLIHKWWVYWIRTFALFTGTEEVEKESEETEEEQGGEESTEQEETETES